MPTPTDGMLDSLDLEAEKCCWKAFSKSGLAGDLASLTAWECPKCGQEYRPRENGSIRYWRAHVVAVRL